MSHATKQILRAQIQSFHKSIEVKRLFIVKVYI